MGACDEENNGGHVWMRISDAKIEIILWIYNLPCQKFERVLLFTWFAVFFKQNEFLCLRENYWIQIIKILLILDKNYISNINFLNPGHCECSAKFDFSVFRFYILLRYLNIISSHKKWKTIVAFIYIIVLTFLIAFYVNNI